MKPEEIEKAKYDAYVEAMGRFRWSVLATTLVASLILIHIVITHVDESPDPDLIEEITRQFQHPTETRLSLDDLAKAKQQFAGMGGLTHGDNKKILDEYAYEKLAEQSLRGELSSLASGTHAHVIPFLQMECPHRCFFAVMGIVLTALCVVVWMSAGSILIPLQTLEWHDAEHVRVLQLHLLFLGPQEHVFRDALPIGQVILYLSIWGPVLVYALCGVFHEPLDITSPLTPWFGGEVVLLIFFAVLTTQRLRRIQEKLVAKTSNLGKLQRLDEPKSV